MATIPSGNVSYLNTARRIYVSLSEFNNDFYSIEPDVIDKATGAVVRYKLGYASGGGIGVGLPCPKGRFLRENGKKVYPAQYPGINTYLVGVYDDVSFLKGYINPNSQIFTILNSDKPTYLDDDKAVDPFLGTTALGNPVYTRGNIFAGGYADISGSGTFGGSMTIAGRTEIGSDLYVAGELVNLSFIGGENIDWRDSQSPGVYSDATLYSCSWDSGNYQLPVNTGSNSTGGVLWDRDYGLGPNQDLHISFTAKNYLASGSNGDFLSFVIGASYTDLATLIIPGATTGLTIQIYDRNQEIRCFNLGTQQFVHPLANYYNTTTADNIWHQYDIILENVDGSTNVLVYIDGKFMVRGDAGVLTLAPAEEGKVGFVAFSGSDNTAHYVRSLTVKPARSWQLTH